MKRFLVPFRNFFAGSTLCALAMAGAIAAEDVRSPALDPAALAQEQQRVAQWKSDRVASLTSDTGWLTLTGLFWLKPGANTFGSAATNTLQLEHAALAPEAGTFFLEGSAVRFVASTNSGVTVAGAPVTDIAMAADSTDDPTMLQSGSLSFYVIDRAGNLGIRVRDSVHPLRTAFHGLDYFPYDDSWVVDARFEPYEPHKQISIINILGMRENVPASGALVFTHGGKEYRLDALLETPNAEELFIMFADETTGSETYGAGRYLYVPVPRDGLVRVNFNTAYNPPCAFNIFATCPLPPPQNRLAVRVEAGELNYESAHLDEAASESPQEQVFAAERAFAKSMADRDLAAFSGLLSDEAIFFSGAAPFRGKPEVVAGWAPFFEGEAAPFSWEPDQVEVMKSGTLALSTGLVRTPDGEVVSRFNSIWRLEAPGVWRVVFDKGSPLEPGDKPQDQD